MKRITKRICAKAIAAMMCATLAGNANAAVIEHIADRYIINVDQMDLNGEESLLDILMMCPDLMTLDGKEANMNSLYGKYAIRIDNVNTYMNPEVFLRNTKAKEVKKVKICVNPGIMKGCGGLKQVIDINYRKNEEGTNGKIAAEGDSYGNASAFVNANQEGSNYTLRAIVQGDLSHHKNDAGVKSHGAEQDMKLHLNWDITSKDNLELFGTQSYSREKESSISPADYNRFYHMEAVYTRDLGEHGAYALVQVAGDYTHSNADYGIMKSSNTNPYAVFEFGFPFISKNVYITAGIETGYSATTDDVRDLTDRSRYEDGYLQVDWTVGNFGLSVGDRLRALNYWWNNGISNDTYEHTQSANHFTASSWYTFNENNTLQATFTRRFNEVGDFIRVSSQHDVTSNNVLNLLPGKQLFGKVFDETILPIYTTELRYTYQKQDFNIMGVIKNVHQSLNYNGNDGNDNTLQIGASAYVHYGVLRLTAGFFYNWERTHIYSLDLWYPHLGLLTKVAGRAEYDNFVNLKLAPQVSLSNGWRFTSLMLYNSRKAPEMASGFAHANFYADLGASKELNEHWLVEAKFHDMVGQHTGNRAVSLGATYSF